MPVDFQRTGGVGGYKTFEAETVRVWAVCCCYKKGEEIKWVREGGGKITQGWVDGTDSEYANQADNEDRLRDLSGSAGGGLK